LLEKSYKSTDSEFIVVYGRRRVGKTYMIRSFFLSKSCLFFEATGMQNGNLIKQLRNFANSMAASFMPGIKIATPKSWIDAFEQLTQFILYYKKTNHKKEKTVIFLDELPWMATQKSGLLEVLDYYWNHHWSQIPDVILVCCGSSASWLIKNIIYNKGGLHNRVTNEISLYPFSLAEVREFLTYRKIKLNDRHIMSLYMALGGVPYYLKYIEKGLTAAQNIQKIMFDKNAPLKDEFGKLFKSLFKNAEAYVELIKLMAKKREGVSRAELEKGNKLSTGGGRLTVRLRDLCNAGFIERHISWQKNRGEYYRLIDEFSLFYLHWVAVKKNTRFTHDHWEKQINKSSHKAWSGYAFESICMKHIEQIYNALKIEAGGTISSWRFVPRKKLEIGAQIDLLIDRNDDAITVCEMKYTDKVFKIDKQYANNLLNKIKVFKEKTKTTKQIFISMISANGVKQNIYAKELIDSVVTLDDLFK